MQVTRRQLSRTSKQEHPHLTRARHPSHRQSVLWDSVGLVSPNVGFIWYLPQPTGLLTVFRRSCGDVWCEDAADRRIASRRLFGRCATRAPPYDSCRKRRESHGIVVFRRGKRSTLCRQRRYVAWRQTTSNRGSDGRWRLSTVQADTGPSAMRVSSRF